VNFESLFPVIEWLGENKVAVGIATLFGLLTGLEFTIKYIIKSAAIARIGIRLGVRSSRSSARRHIQQNLKHLRFIRQSSNINRYVTMAKQNLIGYPILMIIHTLLWWVASYTVDFDKGVWWGIWIGTIVALLLRFGANYFGLKSNQSMADDPAKYRRVQLKMLKAIPR
jgi:xanthine/uracil/vitamin C permease (AzgA family)